MPSIYRRSGTVPMSGFIVTLVLLLALFSITVYATYWIWRFVRSPSPTQDPPDTSSAAIPATSPFSYLDQRPLATPILIHTPSNPIKTTLQPSEPRRPPTPPRSRPSPPLSRPTPPQPRQKKPQPRPNPPPTNPTHPKSRPPTPPLRNPNRLPTLPSISAPAGTGSTGLTHRLPSTASELALATYVHSLSPEQLEATARGDGTFFFPGSSLAASPIPGASSSVAGSEMSALPTNAAFAAEFARREQRLREQGLVGRGWALVMSEGGSVGEGSVGVGDGGRRGEKKGKEKEKEVVPRALDVRRGVGR